MTGAGRPDLEVSAVCRRDEQLLLVRVGHGPAGGEWRLPGGTVHRGETLAESVVARLWEQCGLTVLCGPFMGWREHLDADVHRVRMYFEAVDMGAPDVDPPGPDAAVETEWVDSHTVLDRRLESGLAEFLGDAGVIDAVV